MGKGHQRVEYPGRLSAATGHIAPGSPDWIKVKNPLAPAAIRVIEG
jgi:hypothetical protein